jgi:hypothetical protein
MEKLFKIKNHNSFIVVDTDEQLYSGQVYSRHLFLKADGLLPTDELEVPTKEQVETFYNWTETIFGYPTLTSNKRYEKDLKLVKKYLAV